MGYYAPRSIVFLFAFTLPLAFASFGLGLHAFASIFSGYKIECIQHKLALLVLLLPGLVWGGMIVFCCLVLLCL